MKILLVIGMLLGVIVLIIGIILLLPVHVIIRYRDDNEVKLLYRFLGMTFGETPNPNSPIVKGAKKLTGISKLDSLGTVKGNIEKIGVSATAGQIADILSLLLGRVAWILKYCLVERLNIKAICSGSDAADAAMEYGAVCAVIYPLVGYIQTAVKVKKSGCDVDVRCDFDGTDTVFELDTAVRVRVIHVARALFYIIKKNVEKQVYSQSVPATESAKRS